MGKMFRDRGSYKSSEVVALFVLSFFSSGFLFFMLAMMNRIIKWVVGYFGWGSS